MSKEIVVLTSGLYRFMIAAEEQLAGQKPITEEVTGDLLKDGQTLLERFSAVRKRAGEGMEATIDDISTSLSEMVSELGSGEPLPDRLLAQWRALGCHYESLVHDIHALRWHIPQSADLGRIKPKNLARNLFHIATGIGGIALYEFVFERSVILLIGGSLLGLFICLELLRRASTTWNERLYGRVFSRISRPYEAHEVCTSTWYMAGLFFGVLLLPRHAIELGTLVLAFGDPVASLVGKRWGQRKLFADKSYAGTLAFFLVAALICLGFISWRAPEVGLLHAFVVAVGVSAAGAVAELFSTSTRINDNLTIPIIAGTMAMLLL